MLEYYTGVLFLTTNRIGDFDEAFASRIHISLYYPPLDLKSTRSIFNLNLDMIEGRFQDSSQKRNIKIDRTEILDFATTYFNSQNEAKWNGRQIRNACHTALALAEFRAQGANHRAVVDPQAQVHLKVRDLTTVSNAYLEFIKYLNYVRQGKDSDSYAVAKGLRAKDEEFSVGLARLRDEMKQWVKMEAEKAKKTPGHDAAHAASQPPASSATSPPPQPGPGPTQHEVSSNQPPAIPSVRQPTPSGPIPPASVPVQQSAEQHPPTYGPPQGYPPSGAWPGHYYHHSGGGGGYGPPPGNPGPPPPGGQPYGQWQADPHYTQYPAQPHPPQQSAPQPPYYGYTAPPPQAPAPSSGAAQA